MALAFDSQANGQDDFSHDTLMGLQELDSHLAIFEDSPPPSSGRLQSVTESASENPSEAFFDTVEDNADAHFESENSSVSYARVDSSAPLIAVDTSHIDIKESLS